MSRDAAPKLVIPPRQGGTNDPTNYQLMCEHCNKSKEGSLNGLQKHHMAILGQ